MIDPRACAFVLALCASCLAPQPSGPVVQPARELDSAAATSTAVGLLQVAQPQAGQTAPRSRTDPALSPASEEPPGRLFGPPSFRIYGGYFDASEPSGFSNETQRYSLGVGATWREQRHRIFAIDADLLWTEREFDALVANPPGLPIPARADLSTIGLSGGGRATFPVDGPVRVYGGAGLGLYWSELSARGTGASSGFSRSDDDFSPGAYVLAGVDVTLGHLLLGLSYRHWFVESDFSAFGLEGVDLGGDFVGLVIGGTF